MAGFVVMFALSLVLFLAVCAFLILGTRSLGRAPLPYKTLVEYQLSKVGQPADIILVGDSSLGNAVNAAQWSDITGKKVLNLALTGIYGYAGSAIMLERALQASRPEMVVVMQTSDIATRERIGTAGLDHLTSSWSGLAGLPVWWRENMNMTEVVAALDFARRRGADLLRPIGEDRGRVLKNDYIAQGPPREMPSSVRELSPDMIRADQIEDLRHIAHLCAVNNVPCLYAYGPLFEPACRRSRSYFAALNEIIETLGFVLLHESPLCIASSQLGDSGDHVRPEFKDQFSSAYLDFLLQARATPAAQQFR